LDTIERFAVIIGAMKAGSTTLFRRLSQHPEIAASRIKEPDFFSKGEGWRDGLAAYRALWDWDAARNRVALEASTSYTMQPFFPDVAPRIEQAGGDFRFIYILRHPIDRIESHRRHDIAHARRPESPSEDPPTEEELSFSRYAMQADAYERQFGRDRLLLLHFADLRDRPADLLRRCCEFLGVDPGFEFTDLRRAENRPRRDAAAIRFCFENPVMQSVAPLVPLALKRRLRRLLAHDVDARASFLTPEQRAVAWAELEADVERLLDHYGFDVSGWKRG